MSSLQPHWQNDRVTLYCGDALETLKRLPDESVHCCVTSPPYYGLRDYGVEGQLGLEQTPDEYIAKMVEVFREVRRVLRSDGTLWLNIGDSYDGSGKGRNADGTHQGGGKQGTSKGSIEGSISKTVTGGACKAKDLIGIPWMLAFALRADGWYLRQDIIWNKPNPMPESVRDRCTKSHEYIFLLSKSSRYYFDNKAIAEKSLHPNAIAAWTCDSRASRGHMLRGNPVGNEASGAEYLGSETRNRRSVWQVTTKPYKGAHFAVFPPDLIEPCILAGCPTDGAVIDPFAGSGTTGMVASMHNRNSVLIELNPQYCELIKERVTTGWQKTKPKSAKKKPMQYESQSSLFDVLAS